jgi:Zn-dependent membrane protease YugP
METKKQTILNTNTLIPLGAILVLAGAIFWFATLSANVKANTRTTSVLEARIISVESKQNEITERLTRIETQLDTVIEELRK